jgi:hypothetical protein
MRRKAHNFVDLTGQVFHRLTVIKYLYTKNKKACWLCKCICGKEIIAVTQTLRNGGTKSCGCLKGELASKRLMKHGFNNGKPLQEKFYQAWLSIKARCYNKNNIEYVNYGYRNIIVCDRWLKSFENFRDDMYELYLKHVKEFGINNTSLDRINPNGNYELENCRWATNKEQGFNKRDTTHSENYPEHIRWRNYLTSSLSRLIKQNCKVSKTLDFYLGCNLLEFRQYIESKFLLNMSWDNYGKGIGKWNLDHIIGCNNFDLSKEQDRIKCFNYKNFQPLWVVDHMRKSKILVTA